MLLPWYYKGIAYAHLSLHNEALESFEQALVHDGDCAAAWYQKGRQPFSTR